MAFISSPQKIPFIFRIILWFEERKIKKQLLPARILSWYPKATISSGIMEGMIAHSEGAVTERLLKLVRMQVSFFASCPFCIDMNSFQYEKLDITNNEILALQDTNIDSLGIFIEKEKCVLEYARALTSTPISIDSELVSRLLASYSEKEFVVIVSTIAQVNFWTRTIQGLGIPPEGFTENCKILNLQKFNTVKKKL